uniref:Uncharacterized protein n=1 Tax=mine drainage metagenome TaxID=410659 RepID=E6PUM3_9ZZZZ
MATVIFALVASAPFSVTDALAVMNGAIFGLWISLWTDSSHHDVNHNCL